MVMIQISDMKYAVYDENGKVVVITSCRAIAEYYANDKG